MHPLLAQIVASPWLISPAIAEQFLPMLEGMAQGQPPVPVSAEAAQERRRQARPRDFVVQLGAAGATVTPLAGSDGQKATKPAGSIGVRVVSLSGPLLKDDQECGPLGMATYARYIQSLGTNADVDALVLKIDSPGGQVYGTQTLADAVKNCGKPVVALCDDGLMCSAAYWIGSAATSILATHETCVIGSIGVMAAWADKQAKMEKEGVKFHEVYASQSTQKNADFAAAKGGDYGPMQQRLTAICDEFLGAVAANRGDRLDQKAAKKAGALAGATFHAAEAQELGLIDGIGSLQDAFALCAELVQEQRLSATTTSTNATMKLFDKSKATLGAAMQALVGAETITDDMLTAANDELAGLGIAGASMMRPSTVQALETDAAAYAKARDAAEANVKAMNDLLTAAGAKSVDELVASRDDWKAKAEAYGKQPGAMGTEAEKTGNDVSEEGGDANAKLVDELHEKMLRG